jgi:hypothetical protein
MPIIITCACGRQMRAADEHVGRRVKCPGCEALNLVPQPPAPPKADLIRFPCSCGKTIQAKAEHAGKLTRCPVCGETSRIPAATQRSNGSSPANPKIKARPEVPPLVKRPPRKVEEVEEIEEAEEAEEVEEAQEAGTEEDVEVVEERRPKKKKKRKVGGSWTLLIVLGSAGLFLLCGGCITSIALYFYLRTPDDLKYVPDDAQKMVSLRLADIIAIDKDQVANKFGPPGTFEGQMGMEPTEIERITEVTSKDGKSWTIILTVSSADQKKITSKMFKDGSKEAKYKDQAIIVQDAKGVSDPSAVCFVSGRILLVGQRSAIEKALDNYPRTKTDGVIANGVKFASSGYHMATAQNTQIFGGGELPLGVEGSATGIKITGNRFELKTITTYTSAEKAKAMMDMGKEMADKMKGAFPTSARNDLDVSTTQSGRDIIMTMRGDRDSKGGLKGGFGAMFQMP